MYRCYGLEVEIPDVQSTSEFCANCNNYEWKQPSDTSTLKKCANCKYLSYCSLECQSEHWKKVHKYHCKYLSGKKVQSHTMHESSVCLYCLKESKVGKDKMGSSSSYLGCPWSLEHVAGAITDRHITINNRHVPSPFQLGEITGRFECKVEHTLFTLQRLLYKLFIIHENTNWRAYKALNDLRGSLRSNYCFVPSRGSRNPQACYRRNLRLNMVLDFVVTELKSMEQDMKKNRRGDSMRLIDTSLLLASFLGSFIFDHHPKHLVNYSLKISQEDLIQIWGKILVILELDNWSYQMILDICSFGIFKRECVGCAEDINPNHALWLVNLFSKVEKLNIGHSVVICAPLPVLVFFCGRIGCLNDFFKLIRPNDILKKLSHSRCDHCFNFTNKGHRCSGCLTKFYCGNDCKNEDWFYHKEACFKDKRKIKCGKDDRNVKDHFMQKVVCNKFRFCYQNCFGEGKAFVSETLGKLSQPNNILNPNNRTTISIVGLRQSNHWEPD